MAWETLDVAGLKQKISSLPSNWILLVLTPSDRQVNVNLEMLRFLCEELDLKGLYITVNRPYAHLVEFFRKNNVKVDNLVFIDCISKSVGEKAERFERCLYLNSPSDLTSMGIAMLEAVAMLKGEKAPFLFLDSLSTLLLYNPSNTLGKFSHFTTAKLRLWGYKGVVMSLDEESSKSLIDTISQFCDATVRVQ